MAETDHIHEPPIKGEITSAAWENGYRSAIADVQAHGLPDHEERVRAAIEERVRAAIDAAQSLGGTVRGAIRTYLAWTKEEVGRE